MAKLAVIEALPTQPAREPLTPSTTGIEQEIQMAETAKKSEGKGQTAMVGDRSSQKQQVQPVASRIFACAPPIWGAPSG